MLINSKKVLDDDGSIGYIESIFESQNILKTIYFPKQKKLYISFNRGGTYSYTNIPMELYEEFEKSESQGKFFHEKIRNNKDYPCFKEFNLYSFEIEEIKKIIEENKKNDNESFC